jgi:60 kDa SS-A/Ro ribonucleoprotein
MSRLNVTARTHEGAPAVALTDPVAQLRRSLLACLLWEKQFYEDGKEIAQRIAEVAALTPADKIAELAIEARTSFNLRHAPLLLLEILSRRNPSLLPVTMEHTIQRVDEMAESLAIIFACQKARGQNHRKIPHGWIKGIRRVLPRFDEYQLAKYDRRGRISLRDVLRIARPKTEDAARNELWRRVVKRELATPDTWEVALSAGADKKQTFERLLREGQLGYLALLRNLRNMVEAGVNSMLVTDAILARKGGAHRVYPFRFVAAARAAPNYASALNEAMCHNIDLMPELPGMTVVLVDVSGSMDQALSARSDMNRMDAAAALACIVKGERRIFSFSNNLVEVEYCERGLSGMHKIVHSQSNSGTYLGAAIRRLGQEVQAQRLIVITDEQSHDQVSAPNFPYAYMINVGSYQNGVGYGEGWTAHVTGFSEQVLRYIQATEGRVLTEVEVETD